MINETFIDLLNDRSVFSFKGWRCPVCGEIWDPVIQAHRKQERRPIATRNRKVVVGVNPIEHL
jgi:hypothetical protein